MTYEETKFFDLTIRSQLSCLMSRRDIRPRHYIRDQGQGSNPQDQESENTVLRLPITDCHLRKKSSQLPTLQLQNINILFNNYYAWLVYFMWISCTLSTHIIGLNYYWIPHSLAGPYVMGSNPSIADFHIIVHQPSARWDHWCSAHWMIQFVTCCSPLS